VCTDFSLLRKSAAETSHLRILAGSTIVKLGECPAYQNTLDVARFEQLGLLLQVKRSTKMHC
jgi:hypothetical protein